MTDFVFDETWVLRQYQRSKVLINTKYSVYHTHPKCEGGGSEVYQAYKDRPAAWATTDAGTITCSQCLKVAPDSFRGFMKLVEWER